MLLDHSLQRDGAIIEALSGFARILSGPLAFATSTASSTDWTSLTVSVNSDISGEAGALAALPDEGDRGGGGDVIGGNGCEVGVKQIGYFQRIFS